VAALLKLVLFRAAWTSGGDWGVVKGARKGAFILIEHSRRELRLTPLAFSAIFFFVSVPELSLIRFQRGSTRNSSHSRAGTLAGRQNARSDLWLFLSGMDHLGDSKITHCSFRKPH
jgi:hypothetical protein